MASKQPHSLSRLLLYHEVAFLLLIAVSALLGVLWVQTWQQASRESIRVNRVLYDAQRLRADLYRQTREVLVATNSRDPGAMNLYWRHIYDIESQFYALQQMALRPVENQAVAGMREAYSMLQTRMNKVVADAQTLDGSDGPHLLLEPSYETWLRQEFEDSFARLRESVAATQSGLEQRLASWNSAAAWIFPVPFLLAVGLLVHSHRRIRSRFEQPMARLVGFAEDISRDRFDTLEELHGSSEVETLSATLAQMAADLEKSRKTLQDNERKIALGELVPVVAHNVRNPLASIRATAQVLDASGGDAAIEQSRAEILDTVDRLERWTHALLSYLHPLQPHRRRTRVLTLLDGASAPLAARMEQKKVTLEQGPRLTPELAADVDADLMEQAIHNLLLNAVEAVEVGGCVTVDAYRDGTATIILVDDDGPGLAFMPVAAEMTPGPSTKTRGTGLGIPFAFKVCQAHDGDLGFADSPLGGARVIITLPDQSAEETES